VIGNWVGLLFLNGLAILCGLVMYAYYAGCDPVGSAVKLDSQVFEDAGFGQCRIKVARGL